MAVLLVLDLWLQAVGICKNFPPVFGHHNLLVRPFQLEAITMIAAAILIFAMLPANSKNLSSNALTSAYEGPQPRIKNGVDFLGCLTLVSALASPLLALNLGGNVLPWSHPLVITLFSLTPFLITGFCYIELHVAACPVIPLRFLRSAAILKVLLASVPILFAWNQVRPSDSM